MLDIDLPQNVQTCVGETLVTGASILLPPLKDKLSLLLDMLQDVQNLSRGQVNQ
jgi:hypothetical protein